MTKRAILFSLFVALAACGAETGGGTLAGDIYSTDIVGTDVAVHADVPIDSTGAVPALSFGLAVGDDGFSCTTGDRCTLLLTLNAQRSLDVVYTVDGVGVPSAFIYFAIVEDALSLGTLTALSALTDDLGVGSVDVKTVKPAQGDLVVRASVTDETVPPLYFDVLVSGKSQVPLSISTTYGGGAVLPNWIARLYAQDGSGEPSCESPSDLYDALVPATIQSPPKLLSQTANFLEIPGLEAGGQERFTILVYSESDDGTLLAWGCDDVAAVVSTTTSTSVVVPLVDRPPTFAGTYNVTTSLDLTSGVPEPYKTTVDTVLGLFESPAGQLLSLACGIATAGTTLEDLCGLIYEDPSAPSLDGLTPTGAVVVDLINAVITDLGADSAWGVALAAGKDVADMLTGLQLHGTLTFSTEPGTDMAWTTEETSEIWDGVTLKWGLNAGCDPAIDEECGEKNLFMSALQPEVVTASFAASLGPGYELSIADHQLNLYYGKLLDSVLQKLVLPLAAGDGSDGLAAIDSYEDLIQMLVGGGKECLNPASATTCCEELVASIEEEISLPGASTAALIESACDDLVSEGAQWLSDSLTGLDDDDGVLIGTAAPCPSFDANADLVIDAFGSKEPGGACMWTLTVGSANPVSFQASFVAVRAN